MEQVAAMRREFDALDQQIVQLLLQRFELSMAIGAYKKATQLPREDLARELEIMLRIRQQIEDPLIRKNVFAVYQAILAESKNIQLEHK